MKVSVITPSIRPEGLSITQKSLELQTFQDFEWLVEVGIPPRHDFNAACNRMIKRAQGDIIVSLQDWIKAPPEYLQKFVNASESAPKTLFTSPVGKVDNLAYEPPARWDWRAYEDTHPKWDCWEIDSGCAQKQMFYDVGGFDEYLDQWWSFDNVSVGKRADLLGYKIANLFDNPVLAYDHDAHTPHPFRERFRPAQVKLRMDEYEQNPKLSYL